MILLLSYLACFVATGQLPVEVMCAGDWQDPVGPPTDPTKHPLG